MIIDTENKIDQVLMSFPTTPVKEELKLNMAISGERKRLSVITKFAD